MQNSPFVAFAAAVGATMRRFESCICPGKARSWPCSRGQGLTKDFSIEKTRIGGSDLLGRLLIRMHLPRLSRDNCCALVKVRRNLWMHAKVIFGQHGLDILNTEADRLF